MPGRHRPSLADLTGASILQRPEDLAALIRRLAESAAYMPVATTDAAAAVPLRPEHVSLDREGNVHLAPGVLPTVADLGRLLEQSIGEIRRRGSGRIPPGLVLTAARASGQMDQAPLPSLGALAAALERFCPPDSDAALRRLYGLYGAGVAAQATMPTEAPVDTVVHRAPLATRPQDYQPWDETPIRLDAPAVATARPPVRKKARRRRAAMVLVGATALCAGIAVALYQQPRTPESGATDSTEVVIERAASGTGRAGSTPTAAPRASTPRESIGTSGAPAPPEPLIDPEALDGENAFSPSFAANGTAVFFHARNGNGSSLKRADRGDNGDLHIVTIVDDTAKNYHVQLSPDGKSVAFDSDRDAPRGVYVAAADGSHVRRVSGPGYAAVPTWSPDGRRLAFLRAEDDKPQVWNLWLLELGTGEMKRLTNHPIGQVWGGSWFPDGRRIAYSHEDRLLVLDLESGQVVSYASPLKGRLVRTPAVSPDGRWIIFQVFREGAWLLDIADGSMERVLDDATAEEFTWAPDTRRVAFHSRRSGEWGLWMISPR
jgi:hypothetical protein